MDNRALYLDTARAAVALVAEVPDDVWDNPGLGSWDVRGLVGHTGRALSTVVDYLAMGPASVELPSAAHYLAAAGKADPAVRQGVAQRGVAAGAELGDRPAAAFAALLPATEAALAGVPDDTVLPTALGGMRLADYLATRTFELVVHGSDIAAAIRRPTAMPDEAVAQTVRLAAEVALINGQGLRVARLLTGRDDSTFSVL